MVLLVWISIHQDYLFKANINVICHISVNIKISWPNGRLCVHKWINKTLFLYYSRKWEHASISEKNRIRVKNFFVQVNKEQLLFTTHQDDSLHSPVYFFGMWFCVWFPWSNKTHSLIKWNNLFFGSWKYTSIQFQNWTWKFSFFVFPSNEPWHKLKLKDFYWETLVARSTRGACVIERDTYWFRSSNFSFGVFGKIHGWKLTNLKRNSPTFFSFCGGIAVVVLGLASEKKENSTFQIVRQLFSSLDSFVREEEQ